MLLNKNITVNRPIVYKIFKHNIEHSLDKFTVKVFCLTAWYQSFALVWSFADSMKILLSISSNESWLTLSVISIFFPASNPLSTRFFFVQEVGFPPVNCVIGNFSKHVFNPVRFSMQNSLGSIFPRPLLWHLCLLSCLSTLFFLCLPSDG